MDTGGNKEYRNKKRKVNRRASIVQEETDESETLESESDIEQPEELNKLFDTRNCS